MDYQVLVFPGGFSYGDYVRAGVILARRLSAKLDKELKAFVEENRPILGICNGFQVLVEYGLLPGFEGVSAYPEATLATNIPQGYNCRWVYLKHENKGKCVFTSKIPKGKVLKIPVAHSEGRFLFPREKEQQLLEKLYDEDLTGSPLLQPKRRIRRRPLSNKPKRLIPRHCRHLQQGRDNISA